MENELSPSASHPEPIASPWVAYKIGWLTTESGSDSVFARS